MIVDAWLGIFLLFAFLYRNNLPFAYHIRFSWHVSLAWFCGRRPSYVLAASEKSFRVWPDDIDFNWHMNNSSCAHHTLMPMYMLPLPALPLSCCCGSTCTFW